MMVRGVVKDHLKSLIVSKVLIKRIPGNVEVTLVIEKKDSTTGKQIDEVNTFKRTLKKLINHTVEVKVQELDVPELDAKVIAVSVARHVDVQVNLKRIMKRFLTLSMKKGALGVKILSSGRINGTEIARSEWCKEGKVPLHTLNADVDYSTVGVKTSFGMIGIKVWVCKRILSHRVQTI
jgi:small subunit ribosomal protein S3